MFPCNNQTLCDLNQLFEHLDSECKDLDSWCNYSPKCDNEEVLKKCPKWCGTCKGKRCSNKPSINTLSRPILI